MLTKIALFLLGLVGLVLGHAGERPSYLHVERAATIAAPPETIYPLINDFRTWSSWSPYEKVDPAMRRTFSGAPSGKGAVYEWAGNSSIGEGRMEIADTSHPSQVTIKLDFVKPLEGHNVARFELVPRGNTTEVKWTMEGPTPLIGKLIGVFVNMDTMIGSQFESGLASLKAIAEGKARS